jgi:hypothetical protein
MCFTTFARMECVCCVATEHLNKLVLSIPLSIGPDIIRHRER